MDYAELDLVEQNDAARKIQVFFQCYLSRDGGAEEKEKLIPSEK